MKPTVTMSSEVVGGRGRLPGSGGGPTHIACGQPYRLRLDDKPGAPFSGVM
jgi:hypothetical protein